jgi:transcriptional regulator with GAF, ATPase, and Fis domain
MDSRDLLDLLEAITENRVEQPDLRSSTLATLRLLQSLGQISAGRLYLLDGAQIRAVISHGRSDYPEDEEREFVDHLRQGGEQGPSQGYRAVALCRKQHCYGVLILEGAQEELAGFVSQLFLQWCAVARFVEYQREELIDENYQLREEIRMQYSDRNIVGVSGSFQHAMANARRVAASSATVLIQGETGTGKELIARLIHQHSPRSNKAFLTVNCGALAESLLESELFGHVRGAFTGATADRKGRFEAANDGTIFLDEIGEISQAMQVRLLRVLQEMEVVRVGDHTVRKLDVRVIAATNRDLEAEVRQGRFRADLYYRLNVVFLSIPPLRERQEDIPLLVEHFLGIYSKRNLKYFEQITRDTIEAIKRYPWPGNVRELENCVEKMVVMAPGSIISTDLLPMSVMAYVHDHVAAQPGGSGAKPATPAAVPDCDSALEPPLRRYLSEQCVSCLDEARKDLHQVVRDKFERHLFEIVLERLDNNKTRAADLLGITRTTLNKRLKLLSSVRRDWRV